MTETRDLKKNMVLLKAKLAGDSEWQGTASVAHKGGAPPNAVKELCRSVYTHELG